MKNELSNTVGVYKIFESTDEYLAELVKYGRPRIFCTSDLKWVASIDMHVASEGIAFEISSKFTHETPLNAVRECYNLMIKTLNDLGRKLEV